MRSTGLFDLQVNGFAGVDFNDETIQSGDMDRALEAMLATGVTACLPTLITAPEDVLAKRFSALDRAVASSELGPTMVPGYHLEGPFLNPADGYAGCHPASAMIPPSVDLIGALARNLAKPILLITIAPELPGSFEFVQIMAATGRVVAIGHSAAHAAVVVETAEAGALMSTHLGNGLPQTLHKVDNPIFAQLAEDRLCASFIADGIHLPVPALKTMLRAKGLEKSILVTDAVSAAGTPPGIYPFAGMSVEHAADGSVRLPGSRFLAGSALCLDQAVRNLVDWHLVTPRQAIDMASRNPFHLMGNALAAFGVVQSSGEVDWGSDLRPDAVRIGPISRSFTT
jgi:N-acetylglucosamine-6-phosphate deacetylase